MQLAISFTTRLVASLFTMSGGCFLMKNIFSLFVQFAHVRQTFFSGEAA